MSPRVRKWLKGGAAALAIVVLAISGLLFMAFTGWPGSHIYPPSLANGVITDKDWLHWDEGSRKLTVVLQRRFPKGTPVSTIRDKLAAEGFTRPQHAQSCETTVDLNGKSTTKCRYPADINRRLEYIWGGIPCSNWVTVVWTEDREHRIATISGRYGAGCL